MTNPVRIFEAELLDRHAAQQSALRGAPSSVWLSGAGLGAGEGLGNLLYAYAAAGVLGAVVIGAVAGLATKSTKVGIYTAAGIGTAELVAAGVLAYRSRAGVA